MDQEQRGLDPAERVDQPCLLARVLCVVAGVALVRDERREIVRAGREVCRDVDAAPAIAEVPVVGAPRLPGDELAVEPLPFGKIDELPRLHSERVREGIERHEELVGRHFLRPVPRLQASSEVAVAGQRFFEAVVSRGEALLRHGTDP